MSRPFPEPTAAHAALVAFVAACKDGGMDPHSLLDAAEDLFGFAEIIRAAQQRAEVAKARELTALRWAEQERNAKFAAEAERDAAYERAAKACETFVFYEDDPAGYARQCAAAIRSLKTQEPADAAEMKRLADALEETLPKVGEPEYVWAMAMAPDMRAAAALLRRMAGER